MQVKVNALYGVQLVRPDLLANSRQPHRPEDLRNVPHRPDGLRNVIPAPTCEGCGAPLRRAEVECSYCRRPH